MEMEQMDTDSGSQSGIVNDWNFLLLPHHVLLSIVKCLDAADINNFRLLSRAAHYFLLNNSRNVAKSRVTEISVTNSNESVLITVKRCSFSRPKKVWMCEVYPQKEDAADTAMDEGASAMDIPTFYKERGSGLKWGAASTTTRIGVADVCDELRNHFDFIFTRAYTEFLLLEDLTSEQFEAIVDTLTSHQGKCNGSGHVDLSIRCAARYEENLTALLQVCSPRSVKIKTPEGVFLPGGIFDSSLLSSVFHFTVSSLSVGNGAMQIAFTDADLKALSESRAFPLDLFIDGQTQVTIDGFMEQIKMVRAGNDLFSFELTAIAEEIDEKARAEIWLPTETVDEKGTKASVDAYYIFSDGKRVAVQTRACQEFPGTFEAEYTASISDSADFEDEESGFLYDSADDYDYYGNGYMGGGGGIVYSDPEDDPAFDWRARYGDY